MFLHYPLHVLTLVPRNDDEPARVVTNSLVQRDLDGEGVRAGGIGTLAEKLDRVAAELLAEPLEPLVHLPKDVLVQRPSLGSRHRAEPYPARSYAGSTWSSPRNGDSSSLREEGRPVAPAR
jgi:hypothetical protein